MDLDFSNAALLSMIERRIQPGEVIYAVEHPAHSWRNRTGNLIMYEGYPNGRLIIVAVDGRNPRWVVGVRDQR